MIGDNARLKLCKVLPLSVFEYFSKAFMKKWKSNNIALNFWCYVRKVI